MGNIYQEYTPPTGGSGGSYFKPEDGKSIRARIVSEPVILSESYQGDDPSTRYAVLIYNFDAQEAQVFKMPKTAFRSLVELGREEDWGDPLENPYDVKLKRTGKSTDTVWTVTPSPAKDQLTEDQKAQIDAMNLLKMVGSGNGVENVDWLRDYVANGNKYTGKNKTGNNELDNLDNDPVNLDDIPY